MHPPPEEILRFILEHEPLEATLRTFPGLTREVLCARLSAILPAKAVTTESAAGAASASSVPAEGMLILYTDGASRGNPGLAGAGVVLQDPHGKVIETQAQFLGETTNNVAEYSALILGLTLALRHRPGQLIVRMDSELIVRQLQGRYQVRKPELQILFRKAQVLLRGLPRVQVEHVRRELNTAADRLSNLAIDRRPR